MTLRSLCCYSILGLAFVSCQPGYPEPSALATDPEVPEYKTIAALKTMMGNGPYLIRTNILISGIVIADDRTGNLYKQVIIDDGTAAIPLLLDAYNLFNDYPCGRKVLVHCKGLTAVLNNKLPQLGFKQDANGSLSPVPYHLLDRYMEKGSYNNPVNPIRVSLQEASKTKQELLNRLVLIPLAQVMDTTLQQTYALPPELASATNVVLTDCDSNRIALRSSAYCSFRSAALPKGRGTITAIYSVYNNTPQLIIRDTSDVRFREPRCF